MGAGFNNIVLGSITNFSAFFAGVSDFAHPGTLDLHLLAGCPAIDAGDSLSAPVTDFEGTGRPQGAAFDVGAYEYADTAQTTRANAPESKYQLRFYPNPSGGTFRLLPGNLDLAHDADLDIFNMAGEKVCATRVQGPLSQDIALPARLPSGMYVVHIADGRNFYVGKVVIE